MPAERKLQKGTVDFIPKKMISEIIYRGIKYTSDGQKVWRDGVLIMDELKVVGSIEKITALKIDDYIYYAGYFYKK